jgi:hypothetical protein
MTGGYGVTSTAEKNLLNVSLLTMQSGSGFFSAFGFCNVLLSFSLWYDSFGWHFIGLFILLGFGTCEDIAKRFVARVGKVSLQDLHLEIGLC